jgi:hypothetical protein
MINGMEGGITGPIVEEVAVTAAEKSLSYPSFFIAGMRIEPIALVSATAAPVMPAKTMLITTFI